MKRFFLKGGAALAVVLFASACSSSSGCAGCNTTTIPGGFPAAKTFENGVQLRVSESGLTFLESNLQPLISAALPGGLSFAIPPTGCSGGGSFKVCCKSGVTCSAAADLASAQIDPISPNKVKATVNAKVWGGTNTGGVKKVVKIPIGAEFMGLKIDCDMALDTTKGSKQYMTMVLEMALNTASKAPKKLTLKTVSADVSNLEAGDIKVSGSNALCAGFDAFLSTPGVFNAVLPILKQSLISPIKDSIDKQLGSFDLGQEARVDLGGLLASFSPRTQATLDYFAWAGGYAAATASPKPVGLSLGMLAGFQAPTTSTCVPDCEASGAKCTPPATSAISRSTTFDANKSPGGSDFHVGVGVHRQTVERALYAVYQSGGLCLDVDSSAVSMISSNMLATLLPSITNLTGAENRPALIAIRPKHPAKVTIGQGTYTSSGGVITITDPLLTIGLKDFTIDFYVMAEERMIRIFTVTADLDVPVLLYPDSSGKLQPVLGDLGKAMSNITLTNNELITEPASTITALMPTLLKLATSQLAGALPSVDIPSFQGLKLVLGQGAITGVDKNSGGSYDFLGIFAKLGKASASGSGAGGAAPLAGAVQIRAELVSLRAPDLAALHRGELDDPARSGPQVELAVSAVLPAGPSGEAVEYAYRVDGGFYTGWAEGPRLVVRDPLLWLQGEHTVEVIARLKDHPASLSPEPARLSVTIDTLPPRLTLFRQGDWVRAEVSDLVDTPEQVSLSWSVDDGPWVVSPQREAVAAPAGVLVRLRAVDRAGNVAEATLSPRTEVTRSSLPAAEEPRAGGCAVSGGVSRSALGCIGLLLLVLGLRRRRR